MDINKENLIRLSSITEQLNEMQDELKTKREENLTIFEEANKDIINGIELAKNDIQKYKELIREEAKKGFESDGKKTRFGGIGIRVTKGIEYDEDVAFEYAKEHKICLSLDKTAFKKYTSIQELDFVKPCETVTVTFPKKIIIGE